ncbi:MAG: LmeA family phospholipid-binding protein [Frankia sp.]
MDHPNEGDANAAPARLRVQPGRELPAVSPWARPAAPSLMDPRPEIDDPPPAEPEPAGRAAPTVPLRVPRAETAASGAGGSLAPKRRGRVLLIVGLAVLLALTLMDRVAAHVAPGQIAVAIKKDQQLPNKVDASVGGVPLLTQVLFGKYDDLGFTLHRLQLPGICVDRVNAHLKGLHMPITKIFGKPTKIPVDQVTVAVLLDYADVNKALANQPLHLRFSPAGNAAKVTAQIAGQEGGATIELGARDQQLTITVKGIDFFGFSVPLPGPTVPVPLSLKGLPFDARLTGAKTTSTGLELAGAADHLTLQAPSSKGQPVKGC